MNPSNLIRVMPAQERNCIRVSRLNSRGRLEADFLIAGPESLSGDEETAFVRDVLWVEKVEGRSANRRLRIVVLAFFAALAAGAAGAAETSRGCSAVSYEDNDYIVCRVNPREDELRLFLNGADGEPYSHFNFLKDALKAKGETLVFAMNAGMYHEDRSPVGLYVENGEFLSQLNSNDGPGNFHLKPNGVFLVTAEGAALVEETDVFTMTKRPAPRFATQSGPMLVIGGEIHPRFLPDSDSLKRRNGVGVTQEGEAIFVLADAPVRFHDFAAFFRDALKTPNALYLDGTISRLYAPGLERNDPGAAMGPIVGAVAPVAGQ